MQVRVTRQNISQDELARALSSYIQGEHIEHEILGMLQKKDSHGHEIIPEKYLRTIKRRMDAGYGQLKTTLYRNLDTWFTFNGKPAKRLFLKPEQVPSILTHAQADELRLLIESHFRSAIGLGWNIPKAIEKTWIKAGIEKPTEDLADWIKQSYVAGKMAGVLNNSSSYTEMLKLAGKVPVSRVDALISEAAQQNAAKYVAGHGRKLADIAEEVLNKQHQGAISQVVQNYFSGELRHTAYNERGFTPDEVESLLSTEKVVKGWKELATELKNRFKAEDIGRDWDRIAQTEIRFSTNLGRLAGIQQEGGGSDETEVYYHVQATACSGCKKVYLEKDGVTPKIFKLSEIMQNITDNGGMNVGNKESLIGKSGGWVPGATLHPNDHCYPVIYQKEYGMTYPGGEKDE